VLRIYKSNLVTSVTLGNYVKSDFPAVGTCCSLLTMTATWENVSETQLAMRTLVRLFIALRILVLPISPANTKCLKEAKGARYWSF
jgi:hypothetical protein